jgi:hypothetical protein
VNTSHGPTKSLSLAPLPEFRGLTAPASGSHKTRRWREMDSNFQYAGAVNLVVGPFGWVEGIEPRQAIRGSKSSSIWQNAYCSRKRRSITPLP